MTYQPKRFWLSSGHSGKGWLNLKDKHCEFKKLNSNGKCIADCHLNNLFPLESCDCIGNTGKTMDVDDSREVVIKPGCKIGILPTNAPEPKPYDHPVPETPKSSTSWGAGYVMKNNLKK
jgi:hypothetical protein